MIFSVILNKLSDTQSHQPSVPTPPQAPWGRGRDLLSPEGLHFSAAFIDIVTLSEAHMDFPEHLDTVLN